MNVLDKIRVMCDGLKFPLERYIFGIIISFLNKVFSLVDGAIGDGIIFDVGFKGEGRGDDVFPLNF